MHALDAALLVAFILYCLIAGLRSRERASRNLEEYFLAGRTLKGWQAGISMAATQFAADTPLLVRGLVATAGIFALWRLWIYALAFLMLGFVFAAIVVDRAGGLDAIADRLHQMFPAGGAAGISASEILAFTPGQAKDVTTLLLLAFGLQWLVQMNADGTGYLAQRAMACRSDHDARQAAVVFTFAQILFRSLLWLPLALGLLVLFPPDAGPVAAQTAEREFTYVRGMAELLPVGVKGLLLVGMLAALASTLDTHLNWGASYWANDIYKRLLCEAWRGRTPSGRTLVWVARGANLVILVIALLILPWLTSIQSAWQASLLLGAGMGVLLVLRWLWWRINAWGELATIAASTALAPVLLVSFSNEQEALRLLLMAVGATTAGIATSLATGPEAHERLLTFYRRTRPLGFWGPIAAAAGEAPSTGPRRLLRAATAAIAASASVFCLLTGIGAWLVGSPAPDWLPSRALWIAGLVTLGVALIPVWVRLGFPRAETGAAPISDAAPKAQSIT